MMFASKINIQYEPQEIRFQRSIELPDRPLTIEDITKHLQPGQTFSFMEQEDGYLCDPVPYLVIHGTRLETDEELGFRIARQENYNREYEKFNAKYRSKKK